MTLDLQGKTALVTGSNKNTGEVIGQTLRRSGATVIFHANHGGKDQWSAPGGEPGCYAIEGDIGTLEGCNAVVSQVHDAQLSVDLLINNYGTASYARWDTASEDQWLDMYQRNVMSVSRLVQAFVPQMKRRQWGRIVNLGTIGSHRPGAVMPHYYAAKGALATLGVSLAQELSNTGITVNTVSPGLIHTPELEASYRARAKKKGWDEDWTSIVKRVVAEDFPNPCGRLANRQEVADLVAFLCSDSAAFINGQNIRIDGGAVAHV